MRNVYNTGNKMVTMHSVDIVVQVNYPLKFIWILHITILRDNSVKVLSSETVHIAVFINLFLWASTQQTLFCMAHN